LRRLAEKLDGTGLPSIGGALREMQLAPLHAAVRGLAESGSLRRLTELGAARAVAAHKATGHAAKATGRAAKAAHPTAPVATPKQTEALVAEAATAVEQMLHALVDLSGATGDVAAATARFRLGLEAALDLPKLVGVERLRAGLTDSSTWVAIFGRLAGEAIASVADPDGTGSGAAVDELQLGPVLANVFRDLGQDEAAAWRLVALIRLLRQLPLPSSVADQPPDDRPAALIRALVADEAVRAYIRVNVWEGVNWFHRESFEQVLWWMLALDALEALAGKTRSMAKVTARVVEADRLTAALARAGEASGYQLGKLEAAAAELDTAGS
jgi:hypothetical protein